MHFPRFSGRCPMPGQVSPTVLVVSDDLTLLDELVRHLEEIPHWRLVGSARSAGELLESGSRQRPDAILISDGPARDLASRPNRPSISSRLVVLGREEDVDALRAALDLGAKGFVVWPKEHRRLRGLVEEGLGSGKEPAGAGGSVTALWGPKGGSGTSVLTAYLTAALNRLGQKCVLVDLDLDHGDQSVILGVKSETKNVVDLIRVVDEISPAVLQNVAWQHPDGFGVVFAPASPGESGLVKTADVVGTINAIRQLTGQVVLDIPSGFSDLVYAGAEAADRFLFVVTPDVLSLRRSREAMRSLRSAGIDETGIEIVLNRSGGDITAKDVETVLTRPVVAQIRPDMKVLRASDRGELAKSGLRLLEPLAQRIVGGAARTK
jgi:pilus assembly protein CpaE